MASEPAEPAALDRTKVLAIVGNPKPRSRTLGVAEAVASAAGAVAGLPSGAPPEKIDLAEYGADLFDWSSGRVRDLVEMTGRAAIAVVASPTYKATYTGLLKAFLDWFPTTGMAGVLAIPVMVGAAPEHALAVEVHLRPVLVEIGATLPTRGFFLPEDRLPDLDSAIQGWLEAGAGAALRATRRPPPQ